MKNPHLPNHIAIIPDGNRRWAKEKGLPSLEGHRSGVDAGLKIAQKIRDLEISTTTIWAFSTENWNRSEVEVTYLMRLYKRFIDENLKQALKDKVKIIHLGRKDRIPTALLEKIQNAEEKTKDFDRFYLNIALDYGGRNEIIRAMQKMSKEKADVNNIDETSFEHYLDTTNQPYPFPDLVIRAGGEIRTSGFMIWQAAYAEWIFLEKYFPDITEKDVEDAVIEYSKRQRRFGR